MQTREKKLAIGLGAVVGVMAVWSILKPWYLGPIEQEQAQLTLVEQDLGRLKSQQVALFNATRQMAEWKAQSLPPDPKPKGRQRADALNGQRLYQEWLTDLARHCGLNNPEVSPGTTRAIQDTYVTVQVRVKAEATYSQLCEFLSLFEQTELLHRVDACQIESANHVGDPLLSVSLVAEAVALQNAPERSILFPRTELVSPVDADDTQLTVKASDGFPEAGRFGIRIGDEQLTVSQIKGTQWLVSRGIEGTTPAIHSKEARIDLGIFDPLSSVGSDKKMHPRLAMIAEQNPFTIPPPKPGPVQPYLNVPREEIVYLGNQMAVEIWAEGINPNYGSPKFEFVGDVPSGMKIAPVPDQQLRGLITWHPEDEALIGTSYNISIRASRGDLAQPLTQSLVVRVQERNLPPSITDPGQQVVYSGQPLKFTLKASDENEKQRLTFALGSGAPPEAAIDPATGEFSWTPPGVVTEQFLDIELIVRDDGNPSGTASVKVPVQVKADVAHFTTFVGSLSAQSDASEAWLFDRWNKRYIVLKEGDMLEVADISARLVKVEQDDLVFQRDGRTWELSSGQGVRDMKPVDSPQTAKSN